METAPSSRKEISPHFIFHNEPMQTYPMLRFTIPRASLRAALLIALSLAGRAADFELDWARVSAGTVFSQQAGQYEISGTIGQHDAGEMNGCCTGVQGGFWVVTLPNEAPPVISDGNANLLVQIKESADPLRLGGLVTYTLIVSNQGPATASNVLLTDLLPAGMELVSAASLRPLTVESAEISAQIQQIHVNACAELQILARASTAGLHTNSVSIISEPGDLYTQDNVAAETTAVLNREPKTFRWLATVSRDWENPGNWTPLDGPPTLGDTAIIEGNVPVVLNQSALVSKVLLGVNLEGAGDLLVASQMSWTGGLIQGAGAIQILPGAVLNLEGASSKVLMRGLNNFGTIFWSGSGNFQAFNGPLLRNFPGANFVIATDAPLTRFNAGLVFENAGTVRKLPSGTQSIEASVNNTGMITIEGGELAFISTFGNQNAVFLGPNADLILSQEGTNQGAFHLAPGSNLRFRGATHALEEGASVTGPGMAWVEGGVLHAQGAARIENLSITAGELHSDGVTEVHGTLHWSGGIISGNGTNRIPNGAILNISGEAPKRLMETTLENAGTINWTGAGALTGFDGPVLNNLGEFNWLSPASLLRFNVGLLLNNSGTIRSSFSGVKSAEVVVNNQGLFALDAGEISITSSFDNHGSVELGAESVLALTVNGASSGAFNLAADSNLRFGGGTHYLEEGSVISGAGVATIYSGVVHARGSSQFENVEFSAGEFLADALVELTGDFQWTGGIIAGEGTTRLAPGATLNITGEGQKVLRATTLENSGTINWSGTGALNANTRPIIRNLPAGTFNALSDAPLTRFNAGALIENQGLFRRAATGGTKTMDAAFKNDGKLELGAGILQLLDSFTNTASGDFNVAIDGLSAGAEYAQLDVRSSAQLDGTLSAQYAPGFIPPIPASFQLLTATAITGSFAQTAGLHLAGVTLVPRYSPTTVLLETTEAPPLLPLIVEISQQGSAVRLDWPAEYANVVVESAQALTAPEWTPLEIARGVPFQISDTNQTVFFRLRVP